MIGRHPSKILELSPSDITDITKHTEYVPITLFVEE
jgi:hypothetical protein